MNIRKWMKYFIYIITILGLILLAKHSADTIMEIQQKTYKIRPFLNNTLMLILHGAIGVGLGLEKLFEEKKKDGIWTVNVPKLIILGIPCLYFSLSLIIYHIYVFHRISFIINPIKYFLAGSYNPTAIFQMIFGYVAITSFYKTEVHSAD
jgi:hypothetical protein